MPEPRLPDAVVQYPACGACGTETDYDDGLFCEGCQLAFDSDTLAASYLDPNAAPCGVPCDNYWHGDHKIKQGRGFQCGTCQLPANHATTTHWTACKPVSLSGGEA